MASSTPSESEAIHQRLLSLQTSEESDAAFAERLGLAPQVLSNYKNRNNGLSLRSALRIHEATGVSLDWLLTGRGSPELFGETEADERPFVGGGRFVYDRLLQTVLEMTGAAGNAGILTDREARSIREPIESYLGRSGVESR